MNKPHLKQQFMVIKIYYILQNVNSTLFYYSVFTQLRLAHSSQTSHSHNTQWFTENICSDDHRQYTGTEWLFHQIKLRNDVNTVNIITSWAGDFEILLKFVSTKEWNLFFIFLIHRRPYFFRVYGSNKIQAMTCLFPQTNSINKKKKFNCDL